MSREFSHDASESLNASYSLTADDLSVFIQFHQTQSPAVRKYRVGCLFGGLFATMLLPGLILLTTEKPMLKTARAIRPLLIGPVIFLVLMPLAKLYVKWRTRALLKRMLSEGENSGFYGDCTINLDEDGIRETKSTGETMRKWSSVEKIVVAPEYLFIYSSGIEAFVVPRRAFALDAEFSDFVAYASDHSGVDAQDA